MSIGHRSKRRGHWVIGYLAAFKFRLETSIGQRPVSNRAGKSGSQTLVNTFSAGEGSPQTKHSRRKLPVSSSPLFSSNLQLLVLDISLDYLDCCDEWCQSLVIGKVVGMSTPVRDEFQSAGELGDETRFKRLIPNLALARPTLTHCNVSPRPPRRGSWWEVPGKEHSNNECVCPSSFCDDDNQPINVHKLVSQAPRPRVARECTQRFACRR